MELQIQSDKKLELLMQTIASSTPSAEKEDSFTQAAVWNAVEIFKYQPEENITFASYFRRYEDMFSVDFKNWSDQKRYVSY